MTVDFTETRRMRRRRRRLSNACKDIPDYVTAVDDSSQYADVKETERELQIWSLDCPLSEEEIREYLDEAEKNMSSEKAHEILAYCKFDIREALTICKNFVEPDLLLDSEKQVVRCMMRAEKFRLLCLPRAHQRCRPLKEMLPQQSTSSIMNYYYRNKFKDFVFVPRYRDSRNSRRQTVMKSEDIRSTVSLAAEMAVKVKVVHPMTDLPPVVHC
ncbi:hypothetical protein RB195_025785 [Necator americanus]|uniref:ELM2 domain-containing protein n=1 Tax=Necator americanus TaxID=51031 RepID=A0ABR1ETV3_NECAM